MIGRRDFDCRQACLATILPVRFINYINNFREEAPVCYSLKMGLSANSSRRITHCFELAALILIFGPQVLLFSNHLESKLRFETNFLKDHSFAFYCCRRQRIVKGHIHHNLRCKTGIRLNILRKHHARRLFCSLETDFSLIELSCIVCCDMDAYEVLYQRQSGHYSAHRPSHRNDHCHCSNLLVHHGPSTLALLFRTEPISIFDSLQSLHLTCSIFRDCLYFLI